MTNKFMLSLPILCSMLFSCAHVLNYDVSFIGSGYTHNGEKQANNMKDYEVTFTPNFGYVMNDFIEVYCGTNELVQNTHYTYNNGKLRVSYKIVNAALKIKPTVDTCEFCFNHNFDDVKSGYDINKSTMIENDTPIDINYGTDVVFDLYSANGKYIPSNDKFKFTVSDERFYSAGKISFNRNNDNTNIKITIPKQMLGCNITLTIPEVI